MKRWIVIVSTIMLITIMMIVVAMIQMEKNMENRMHIKRQQDIYHLEKSTGGMVHSKRKDGFLMVEFLLRKRWPTRLERPYFNTRRKIKTGRDFWFKFA